MSTHVSKEARLHELKQKLQELDDKPFLSYRDITEKEGIREKIYWLTAEQRAEVDNQRANRAIFISMAIMGFCLGIALGLTASIGIMTLFK